MKGLTNSVKTNTAADSTFNQTGKRLSGNIPSMLMESTDGLHFFNKIKFLSLFNSVDYNFSAIKIRKNPAAAKGSNGGGNKIKAKKESVKTKSPLILQFLNSKPVNNNLSTLVREFTSHSPKLEPVELPASSNEKGENLREKAAASDSHLKYQSCGSKTEDKRQMVCDVKGFAAGRISKQVEEQAAVNGKSEVNTARGKPVNCAKDLTDACSTQRDQKTIRPSVEKDERAEAISSKTGGRPQFFDDGVVSPIMKSMINKKCKVNKGEKEEEKSKETSPTRESRVDSVSSKNEAPLRHQISQIIANKGKASAAQAIIHQNFTTTERVALRCSLWKQEIQEKLEQKKKHYEAREMRECSFRPKTRKYRSSHSLQPASEHLIRLTLDSEGIQNLISDFPRLTESYTEFSKRNSLFKGSERERQQN